MVLDNESEVPENYDDMDVALDRQEEVTAILRNLSDFYESQKQLSDKGKLLGHYKSRGLIRTYIDVYEKAVVGRMRVEGSKKIQDVSWGYACLAEAIVENSVLYFYMNSGKIYRIRYLRRPEIIAYLINGQKIKNNGG